MSASMIITVSNMDHAPFPVRRAMDVADKAALASKRVSNIIETMTFNVYRYISRCGGF